MPWPTTTGSDLGDDAADGRRTIWDLAILVLGVNIWVSFLLLPVLHLEETTVRPGGFMLLLAGPICLALGTWWRHTVLLLVVYPLLLLVPALAAPQLVGPSVYTTWTFVLVAASLLAYLLATPLLLGLMRRRREQEKPSRDLERFPYTPKWRRRMRMYRGLAALAGVFPAVLVFTLYLQVDVRADLERNFPGRLSEALTLFGLLVLLLWLGLFHTYVLWPLKAHIRGDPQVRYELQQLRREVYRKGTRPTFYLYVGAALVLMLMLVLAHW